MMRRIILPCVLVLLGLAVGVGSVWMITKPKIDNSKAMITDMQTKLQKSEATSQKNSQSYDTKISKLNIELAQTKAELRRAKTELAQASGELAQVRAELEQARSTDADVETAAIENAEIRADGTAAVDNIPTVEYVVKEGDNFWKIAASQLGDGSRSNEIIKLNPDAAKSKYLTVGMKLKLPAK